jgi:hypothetical protein
MTHNTHYPCLSLPVSYYTHDRFGLYLLKASVQQLLETGTDPPEVIRVVLRIHNQGSEENKNSDIYTPQFSSFLENK